MKRTYGLGLIVLAVFAFGANSIDAQTTANGPYYATPSWDQTLACTTLAACPRFIVLLNWNSEAVLDRETGLVWQRTVGGIFGGAAAPYGAALELCSESATGGREGWRLPSIHELQSLIDPTVAFPALALPSGHPFLGVPPPFTQYWTGTSVATDPASAYFMALQALSHASNDVKTAAKMFWCVRGGGPTSVY